jgi:hypothetical protein
VSSAGSSVGGIIVLAIIGFLLYNIFKPSVWTAVYESPTLITVQSGGEFKDKESCLRWIYSARLRHDGNYGYECGKDCRPLSHLMVFTYVLRLWTSSA